MEPQRVWNPPNPYLTEVRELLGEPPAAELEVYEDTTQSILSTNTSPDIGFRWSVNPYRGCFHACSYCFARPTHEYLGMGAGTDFERKIVIKRRAPQLLEAAFRRKSWRGDLVMFSGVTDCYQPLEAVWKLTRGCMEVCAKYRNPVGIITKSLLIRRDIDVLADMARLGLVRVCLSIAFADEAVVRAIEPGTPTIRKRFETMELLARAGIPVGIGVAPVIPGLNDMAIPTLLKEARARGATSAFHLPLRLPGSVRASFFHRLQTQMPLVASKVEHRIREIRGGKLNDPRWGHRFQGQGTYWEQIDQLWNVWFRRLGFDRMDEPPRTADFHVPSGQLEFSFA